MVTKLPSITQTLSRRRFFQSGIVLAAMLGLSSGLETVMAAQSSTESPVSNGYLVVPNGNGPFPAIVLIHEWRGLDESIKTAAQHFVQAGFAVFVPDLYEGMLAEDRGQANQLLSRITPEAALAQVANAIRQLQVQPFVKRDRIGIATFGLGDGLSLKLAQYQPNIPVLVLYGGDIPAEQSANTDWQTRIMESDIQRLVSFPTKIYGNVHSLILHTFGSHTSPENRHAATNAAWHRSISWLIRQFS